MKNPDEKIPENLKDISKILGCDIRQYLAHEKMGRPCSQNYPYKDLCSEIDELMIKKYKDSINFTNKIFKKAASSLLEEYFDVIGEEKSREYFPQTFPIKDRIILNVIYDKQQRKNMNGFGRSYGNDAFSTLLKNPKLMKGIIDGEITDSNYKTNIRIEKNNNDNNVENEEEEEEEDSYDNKQLIINKDSKSITIPLNSDLASNKKALNFYKNIFIQIMDYKDDLDFGNPLNKKRGISGEAYIYELLLKSGKYKRVKWLMLSETNSGESFEYNGKVYNINGDSHYDILVETFDNHKFYIEVKSTKDKFGKKVPFYLSRKQIEMIKSIKSPDKYILAVVLDVFMNPKHFFMISK